jgi:hypothetical protein
MVLALYVSACAMKTQTIIGDGKDAQEEAS